MDPRGGVGGRTVPSMGGAYMIPMATFPRATSTISLVVMVNSLISRVRSIWSRRRVVKRKLPLVIRVMHTARVAKNTDSSGTPTIDYGRFECARVSTRAARLEILSGPLAGVYDPRGMGKTFFALLDGTPNSNAR